jgi:hypothetical protein
MCGGGAAELRDVVVGEVDCVVVLLRLQLSFRLCALFLELTRAAPIFSMAEILWPRYYTH